MGNLGWTFKSNDEPVLLFCDRRVRTLRVAIVTIKRYEEGKVTHAGLYGVLGRKCGESDSVTYNCYKYIHRTGTEILTIGYFLI